MAEIVNIDIFPTVETVSLIIEPNLITINVNTVVATGSVTSVNGMTGAVTLNIPAEQVNSDWNATTGKALILNKPIIPSKTSELINDGDNGTTHFISLEDLPSNVVFFPTTASSDIAGYSKMVTSITDPDYNTVAVNVSTGGITTTNQLVSSLATSTNIIVGNPGVFNITTIGNIRRISGTGTASFFFRVYKRDSEGTETLIATSDNTIPVLDSGTFIEFSATAIWNDGIFLATDRVVIKYLANRISGGSTPTYQFQFGGITPIRTLVPIPLTVIPFVKLDDIADVSAVAPNNNEILTYDTATLLWKPKTVLNALGYTPIKSIIKDTVQGSTITGVTTEVLTGTYLIPANTFGANDIMKITSFFAEKTGTAGTCTIRVKIGSTNVFSSATLLASHASATANLNIVLQRSSITLRGGNIRTINPSGNVITDIVLSSSALSSIAFNPAIDNYIFTSLQLSVGTDSVFQSNFMLTN